jgi:hypothetical protein
MTGRRTPGRVRDGGRAAVACFAAPVAAQEEDPPPLPINVTPSSGAPGTVFTISGEDCLGEEGPGDVEGIVFFIDNEVAGDFALTADADGSWAVDFDTGVPEPLPPGVYTVTATCFVSPESEKVIEYDFADFELTAPPEPPTTPTTTPPTPKAPPAVPVVEEPDFTG